MELIDYVRIVRAHWVGVLVLTMLTVAAAAGFSLSQAKVYAANANGFVSSGMNDNPALASVGDTLAKSRAKSYVDIAKSRATAQAVITRLGLHADPASLIGNISVEQPLDTVLIKITATAPSPRAAQQLADAWISALAAQVASIEDPKGQNGSGTLRVVPVESAELPTSPVYPRTNMNLLLGLVLGLGLGLGYAVVRNQLDRRLRTAAAVEKQFGVTVAGVIPESAALRHVLGARATLALDESASTEAGAAAAEAVRKLRTNLQFMDVDNPPRVIVVTSPAPGDGKSTTAANLACALAVSGQKVTLVDGDLRRPTVADSFGLVEGAGLTDVLVGRVEVGDVLQTPARYPELAILAAGGTPPNPSELLGSQAMRKLLRRLAKDSIVIIDGPPLLPVTDSAVLTAVADGAFVVISAGRTLDTDLGTALGNLEAVKGRLLGVILNRATRRDGESNYDGGHYYRVTPAAKTDRSPLRRAPRQQPVTGADTTPERVEQTTEV